MTREETKDLIEVIKVIYPSFQKDMPREVKSKAIDLWTSLFANDEYNLVVAATHAYITNDVKGFAPSPGQIKEKIRLIKAPKKDTEIEAWGLVKKALKNSAYNSVAEYKKLPPIIQSILTPQQLKEWATANIKDEQVIASNFMRSFKQKSQRTAEIQALPTSVKQILGQFQESPKALEIMEVEENEG